MKRILEILWSLFLVVFCVMVMIVVTGCATPQPKTQADLLYERARIEERMYACSNAGGIWMSPVGRPYSGKCDWHGRFQYEQ